MNYDNVYTFFGADSKVGVTMVTTSIAEILSETSKVLIINTNKRLGVDYIPQNSEITGIEEILNKLNSNILEYEDLEKIIIKNKRLDIIPGFKDIEKCRYFKPEYISMILECVNEIYDLILIDAGSDFEFSGFSIGALNSSKNTVLVLTQQEKTWNELQRLVSLSERMNIKYKYLIVNKMQPKGSGVISLDSISETVNAEDVLGKIPHSLYSWQAESDYKTLSNFDQNFKNSIVDISKLIAMDVNIRLLDEKKKGFQLFKKKN